MYKARIKRLQAKAAQRGVGDEPHVYGIDAHGDPLGRGEGVPLSELPPEKQAQFDQAQACGAFDILLPADFPTE